MKFLNESFAILSAIALLSCNTADNGFSAPVGSTVEITGAATTPSGEDSYVVATVKVTVPFNEDSVPGNNIQVSVFCNRCSLFDRASGETISTDPSRLTEVDNPYSFATQKDGTYQFVVKVENPSDLGLDSYDAKVTADITVATSDLTITVGSD